MPTIQVNVRTWLVWCLFLNPYIKCNLSPNAYINRFLIKSLCWCHLVSLCEKLPILLTIFKSIKATDSISLTIVNMIFPVITQMVPFFKFESIDFLEGTNWAGSLDSVYERCHVTWHFFKTKLHLGMVLKILLCLEHSYGKWCDIYILQVWVARLHS